MEANSSSELLYLRWKNHYSSLYGSFLHFFANPLQTNYDDATIACDGAFYPVHRIVLAVSSPYFAQMFSTVNKIGHYPVIVLKDIPRDIFEVLLKFIYLGEVNVEKHKFPSLIKAAKCLSVNGLCGYDEMIDVNAFTHTRTNHTEDPHPSPISVEQSLPETNENGSKRCASSRTNEPECKKLRIDPRVTLKKLDTSVPFAPLVKQISNSYTTTSGITITPKDNSDEDKNSHSPNEDSSSQSILPVILEYHSLNNEHEKKTTESNEKEIVIKTELPEENSTEASCTDLPGASSTPISQIFECSPCSFKSFSKEEYTDHMQKHAAVITNRLNLLNVAAFASANNFDNDNLKLEERDDQFDFTDQKVRTKLEGSITSFNCSLCSFSSPNKQALTNHGLIHKGGKGFQCADCSYSTIHKHSLVSHRRIHTGEKPYRCLFCDYSSRQKGSILYHQKRRHAKSKLYKCNDCQFKSGKKNDFEEHVMIYHFKGDYPSNCPKCKNVTLQNKKEHIKHMESHMPNDKVHRCPICFYSTRNRNVFNLHVIRHKNRRRLKKRSDGFSFSGIEDDAIDDLPEPVNGLYYCNYCAFKTPHKGVLTVHIRRHTGEKPYACHLCDYRSAQAGNLDSHLKNHEIRKNHMCPHCTYSAGYEANLERHVKRDHLNLPPSEEDDEYNNENDSLYPVQNEPGNHEDSANQDGEGSSNPLEAMCQVQFSEPNEEVYLPAEFLMSSNADGSYNNQDQDLGDAQNMLRFPPKERDPNAPDPYVTEVNGVYRCNECFYATRDKADMETHQNHHESEKKCKCVYCDYRCIRNQHLNRHVQKYKGGDTIKCEHCEYKTCVLNARHRKMCHYFHDLFTNKPDVRINNKLAMSGLTSVGNESNHVDLDTLMHPTTGTSYARGIFNPASPLLLMGNQTMGQDRYENDFDEPSNEDGERNSESPIFDPEFDMEVEKECNEEEEGGGSGAAGNEADEKDENH